MAATNQTIHSLYQELLALEVKLKTVNASYSLDYNLESEDFICPITREVILDPVIADDGITYNRDAIKGVAEEQRYFSGNSRRIRK